MTEFTPERQMSNEEQDLAAAVYQAIQNASNYSERSQQSADFRIGISDLGWCSEKVRRMVAGIPEPVTDKLPAFIGTALGDHIEKACHDMWPHAIVQAEVIVHLHGDGGTYALTGHPDFILPNGVVIDFKTSDGLGRVKRSGPDQQKQFQRHCYGLGAYTAGMFQDWVTLDDVKVANVWLDRTGREREAFVDMEPFSMDVVEQAGMWVDDLVYAYRNEQEARKEPAREICAKTCGHFTTCRSLDTDVQGLLTDEGVLTAVDMYREGLALERTAKKLKDEAKNSLTGVSGSTGKFSLRWVEVGGTHVEFDRQPYSRLDIRSTS